MATLIAKNSVFRIFTLAFWAFHFLFACKFGFSFLYECRNPLYNILGAHHGALIPRFIFKARTKSGNDFPVEEGFVRCKRKWRLGGQFLG
jgi:hypothetical protein